MGEYFLGLIGLLEKLDLISSELVSRDDRFFDALGLMFAS
jgi:hypothetical protein